MSEDEIQIRDRIEETARRVAREEIASFCGLALKRLQEDHPSRSMERNMMDDKIDEVFNEIFGEALQQFSD